MQHSFQTSGGADYSLQLPRVGDGTHAVAPVPAFGGLWRAPLFINVYVDAESLPLKDRIEVVRPALIDSGALTWTGNEFVVPSVCWTDTTTEHHEQFVLFVLGSGVGILGSLIMAVAFEWARRGGRLQSV